MDFWAQHKEFVLKVLAGLGVFLVALIARGVVYGDELELALRLNRRTAADVLKLKIADDAQVSALEDARDRLNRQTARLAGEIGWNAAEERLDRRLIERALSRTRGFRLLDDAERAERVAGFLGDIRADINGGFGLLRGSVHGDLREEASERNITLPEGLGFSGVLQIDEQELEKYLLQLELSARLVRYCIDARVTAVDELRITTKPPHEVIPGGNPEFLREYPVSIAFRGTQAAATAILNRLETESPRVPWQELKLTRLERPANDLGVELTVVAVAADPEVDLAIEKKEGSDA